jgi:hypothetical protein
LHVLPDLFGEVLIPPAVVRELEIPRPRFRPLSVVEWDFLHVRTPREDATVEELLAILELGEAEAIALASEVHADALLIDEAAGRAEARRRGLLPIGALGILVRAKRRGHIDSIRPLLDRLPAELGFFISPAVRREILAQAGESDVRG